MVDGLNRIYDVYETQTGRLASRVPPTGYIPLGLTDEWKRETVAPLCGRDGRAVLVRVGRPKGFSAAVDATRTRLWDVDTGDSFPVPAEFADEGDAAVVERGTAGAVWMRSRPTAPGGPAEVTVTRWDRVTGAVKGSGPFVIGQGDVRAVLSRDGGTVYWVAAGTRTPGKFEPPPANVGIPPNPWFEGWDVTTPVPARRFGFRVPTLSPDGFNTRRLEISPSGVMAAFRSSADEVVVYGLSDGEVHARLPLTGAADPAGLGGAPARARFALV